MIVQFWKIRITTKYLKIDKSELQIKLLKDSTIKNYIVVNEFWSDKKTYLDHIQFYIESEQSERGLRTTIKQLLTEGGNKAFSMDNRHSDWNGYKGYLLKYDDTVLLFSSYTETELSHFKEYYRKVSKPTQNKQREIKLENDLQQILEIIDYKFDNKIVTIRYILDTIITYYKDNKRVMHLANINQLAWSVKTYLDGNEHLINKILREDTGMYQLDYTERGKEARNYAQYGPE